MNPVPRLASRLLGRLAGVDATHLLGDLEEGFADVSERSGPVAAHVWYWRQASVLSLAFGARWIGRALSPSDFLYDMRVAARGFRRTPGLFVVGVLTLGIGIAGPTTMFGIVDGMFAGLPVDRPDEVVDVALVDPVNGRALGVTGAQLDAWRETSSSSVSLGAYEADRLAVSGEAFSPVRTAVGQVTPEVFSILGVRPVAGRLFAEADARAAAAVAVIGEAAWEDWFGRSPQALGALIRIGGELYTVVGVAPRSFGFPQRERIWTLFDPRADPAGRFEVLGRLAPGATVERARAEVQGATDRSPVAPGEAGERRVVVDEYVLATFGRSTRSLLGRLTVVVSFLVVLAAANLAALFLARGTARSAETAVRRALGAGRVRVARQVILEALLVAAGGAILAVPIAQGATRWFAATLDSRGSLPYWADFGLRPATLAFTGVLVLVAAIAAGLIPALRSARTDLSPILRGAATGRSTIRSLPWLVGAEVMLSCVLLILSGVIVKGALGSVQRVGAFPLEGVLTGELVLEAWDYPMPDDRAAFWSGLTRALEDRPDVQHFTLASAMPGDGTRAAVVSVAGHPYERAEDRPRVQVRIVEPHFFDMFGMRAIDGRLARPTDGRGNAPVAVVNEAYARQHLRGSAVGQRLLIDQGSGDISHDVIGVVTDPGVSVDDGRRVPAVFVSLAQTTPASAILAVRARDGMDAAREIMMEAVGDLDPALPVAPVRTLEWIVRRENDGGRLFGSLFGALGACALLLALVGLHGVVAFTMHQRVRDIGLMHALGAQPRSLVAAAVLRGMRPVLPGIAIGLAFAWAAAPGIAGGAFESDPRDPLVFLAIPLLLLAGTFVATLIPTARAARFDPMRALRSD